MGPLDGTMRELACPRPPAGVVLSENSPDPESPRARLFQGSEASLTQRPSALRGSQAASLRCLTQVTDSHAGPGQARAAWEAGKDWEVKSGVGEG